MKEITKAILAVMKAVKSIDKDSTIGAGKNSYKGVSDKAVKQIIGQEMQKNGLIIIPTSVEPKTTVDRYEVDGNYGKQMKQSVFTEVITKYTLYHTSGESIEISGYGHGVDNQDKGAGKATTYALKYALLYIFLVPTGNIDDTDNTHSNEIKTPKQELVTPAQVKLIQTLHTTKGRSADKTKEFYKIESMKDLKKSQALALIESMNKLPEATLQ